jgi:hypothetical protein
MSTRWYPDRDCPLRLRLVEVARIHELFVGSGLMKVPKMLDTTSNWTDGSMSNECIIQIYLFFTSQNIILTPYNYKTQKKQISSQMKKFTILK